MEAAAGGISASDWAKGIGLSVLASIVGGVSKLAIRKSWLLQAQYDNEDEGSANNDLLNAEHTPENEFSVDDHSLELTVEGEQLLRPRICCSEKCCIQICATQSSSCCCHSPWFPYFLRYLGMLGMSVLNPICCVLAMNYASPSILAPFSGLTLCWVILGSPFVNNEKPSLMACVASSLIIAGEVLVAVFGDHTNDEGVTVEDVKKSYLSPFLHAYFVGLVLYVSLLLYWMRYSKSSILRRFAWGSCGGSITGAQNFLKDSLTILKGTQSGQHLPWFFYLFIVSAAGTAFTGLIILTACMKRYDATYSAASFVGSFVVSASVMATAHYNTFAELDGIVNYVLYPFGLLVLMVGVCLLVRDSGEGEESSGSENHDDEEDKEESEGIFGYTEVNEDVAREETVV